MNPSIPSWTLSESFSAAATEHLRNLREGEMMIREKKDLEGVHLMRTSARRLRASIRFLGGHLAESQHRFLQRGLRSLMGALGPVRDLDVLQREIPGVLAQEPAEAERLRTFVGKKIERARKKMNKALDGDSYRALLAALESAAGIPAAMPPTTAAAPARILKAIEKVGRLRPAAWEPASDESLHETRKSIKRLRYTLEAFRPAYGRPLEKMIERCRELQDALGTVQDVAMFGTLLAGRRTFGAGQFLATIRARAQIERARLPELWKRALGEKALGRLGAHLFRRVTYEGVPAPQTPELRAVV